MAWASLNQTYQLFFEGFDIQIHQKSVKYARIRISKDGQIVVSAPLFYTNADIFSLLSKHKSWLETSLKKQQSTKLPPNQVQILCKIYTIKFDPLAQGVCINGDEIIACDITKFDEYKLALAKSEFSKIIDKFLPLIGKDVRRVVVRKMSTRWGSCNHKKGYINLNLHLIEKDYKFIEYVILHELAHLIFPHHQKSFYEFIERIMPDYKERTKLKFSPKMG